MRKEGLEIVTLTEHTEIQKGWEENSDLTT